MIILLNLPQRSLRRLSPHDLASRVPVENRDGQLSRAQVWALARRLLVLSGSFMLVPLGLPSFREWPSPFPWVPVLIIAVGFGVILVAFVRAASDLVAGRAESCAGTATTSVQRESVRWRSYFCSIEGCTIKVPQSVYEVIQMAVSTASTTPHMRNYSWRSSRCDADNAILNQYPHTPGAGVGAQ